MNKRSKKVQVFQTILAVTAVLLSFIVVFFVKCINNMEYVGYFMYNEETETYDQLILWDVRSVSEMTSEDYVYRMNDIYYTVELVTKEEITEKDEVTIETIETVDENGNVVTTKREIVNKIPTTETVTKPVAKIIPHKTFGALPDDIYHNCVVVVKIDFFSKENFVKTTTDPSYWILSIAISATLTIAYVAVYLNQRQNRIESDDVQAKIVTYNDRVKLKPVTFDEYARLNNLDEKKKVYKRIMTEKLAKKKGKLILIPNEKMNSKKAKKLQLEIEAIKRQLTDEYINENILGLKVKYEAIHPENYRENAYDKTLSSRKDYSDEGKRMTATMTRKLITSFISAALLAGLVWTCYFNFAFGADFWVVMITTLLSNIAQVVFGYRFANAIVRQEIEVPVENKTVILQDAIKWAMQNHTNDKTYEELLDEYLAKRVEAATDVVKEEYNTKLSNLQNQFNNVTEKFKEINKIKKE